jgi:hypothetical protein
MRAILSCIVSISAVLAIQTPAWSDWYCEAEGGSKFSDSRAAGGSAIASSLDEAKAGALADCSSNRELQFGTRPCSVKLCEPRNASKSPAGVYWWECQAEGSSLTPDGDDFARGQALAQTLADAKSHALAECAEDAKSYAGRIKACVIKACGRREASK